MGSPGQIGGAGLGAVLGAVVLAPLTAGASLGELAFGQIAAGAFLGLGIGGALGGIIDPPRISGPKGQHEILQVQFNTFANDLPVAISFGRVRLAGNTIFIGDTNGQVETVGQQTTGSGKQAQTQNVEKVIYYADFVIALVEGPIQRVYSVYSDDQDISNEEGNLFSILHGDGDEGIPDIVTNAKYSVVRPVPWRGVAKIVWSGRIGEQNQIPRITAEFESPATTIVQVGAPTQTLPNQIDNFIFDDLSGLIVARSGDYSFVAFDRSGSVLRTTTIPNAHGKIERVFYDGRSDTVLVYCMPRATDRVILRGELEFNSTSAWQLFTDGSDALLMGIDAFVIDDGTAHVWTVHRTGSQIAFVRMSFVNGTVHTLLIQLDTVANVIPKGLHFDKSTQTFYFLYTRESVLYLRRFQIDGTVIIPGTIEEMSPGYGYADPLGVCLIGELVTIFDKTTAQPIHQFEWGRTTDRFTRGVSSSVPVFHPNYIDGLTVWLDPEYIASTYSDGQAIPIWSDRSGYAYNAQQGTVSRQPLLKTNQINGRPVVRFDGSDDFMDIDGPSIDRQNCTVFVVFKPTSASNSSRTLLAMTDGDTSVRYAGIGGSGVQQNAMWTAEEDTVLTTTVDSPNEWAFFSILGTPEYLQVWKNGTFSGFANHTNPGTEDTTLRLGNYFSGSVYFQGDVAEIVIFNRKLTDEERTDMELYFRYRYHLAWNPSGKQYQYIGLGSKFAFSNPRQFFYADRLRTMMVLDSTNSGWYVYWFQWNGANWSYINRYSYRRVYFEEQSSPAGAVYTLLTDPVRGINIPTWTINLLYFERASGRCNSPTLASYYVSDPISYDAQLQVDYLLTTKRQAIDCIREILAGVNGFLITVDGQLGILIDGDEGIVEGSFTEDSIILDSFSHGKVAREDRYNEIICTILDRGNSWKRIPVPFRVDFEMDLYGELHSKGVDLPAVTRPRQAAYIAETTALSSVLREHVCSFTTGPIGLRNTVGDVVEVSHSLPGWVKKKMIIVAMQESTDETIKMDLIEFIPLLHAGNGFALQDPQRLQNLTNVEESAFATVNKSARVRVIEDTVTTQVWLFASQPDNAGPWDHVRWLGRWIQSVTPSATNYPGAIPFTPNQYYLILSTSHFTASALLIEDISAVALNFHVGAIMGTVPENGFEVILYNPEITTTQFANNHGNGKYERMLGSTFWTNQSQVNITNIPGPSTGRGYHTTALAHSRVQVTLEAHFTRLPPPNEVGLITPPTVSYWHQLALTMFENPLSGPASEWFLGFKVSEFVAGSGGINYIDVVIDGLASLVTSPGADLRPDFYYSTGNTGVWKELTGIRDETLGFRQSGKIAFDIPSDWASNTQWSQGYDFPVPNGYTAGSNVARYYIKIVVGNPNGVAFQRSIQIVGQATYTAKGFRAPICYFMLPNAQALYDFNSVEQGYAVEFTPQPVGPHGQSIEIVNLNPMQYTFRNLAAG